MSRKNASESRYWSQTVLLDEFVVGALSGRLKFAPSVGAVVPLHLHAARTHCWSCKKETSVLIQLELAVDSVFSEHGSVTLQLRALEDAGEFGLAWLNEFVPQDRITAAGIGALKRRYSHTQKRRYLSNGCAHCDALQGQFFEHEVAFEARNVLTLSARVEDWMEDASESPLSIRRWWFDRRSAA
jgi:competence protein CoiA